MADLKDFFPFSQCTLDLCSKATRLGKVISYEPGTPIITAGEKALNCGMILNSSGQALESQANGQSICLKQGCFIGLDIFHAARTYDRTVVAAAPTDILYWDLDNLQDLQKDSTAFSELMRILDEGRCYQRRNAVPGIELSEPVLCALPPHSSFIHKRIFPYILLLFLVIAGSFFLPRRTLQTAILLLLIPAGICLINNIIALSRMRLIVTSEHLILQHGKVNQPQTTIPLNDIQTIEIRQDSVERLFYFGIMLTGNLMLLTANHQLQTFPIGRAKNIAQLIKQFQLQNPLNPPCKIAADSTITFRAHWAFLAASLIKPCLFSIILLIIYFALGPSVRFLTLRRILIVLMILSFCMMVYQFFIWEGNVFKIKEDRISDINKIPFVREDEHVALVQKIQSVRANKEGFFQILFNFGTVFIRAGEAQLDFNFVSNPKDIRDLIMDTCSRFEEKLKKESETRAYEQNTNLAYQIGNQLNTQIGQHVPNLATQIGTRINAQAPNLAAQIGEQIGEQIDNKIPSLADQLGKQIRRQIANSSNSGGSSSAESPSKS